MTATVHLFKGNGIQPWFVRLVAANGQTLSISEGLRKQVERQASCETDVRGPADQRGRRMTTGYSIVPEFHASQEVYYNGTRRPSIEFKYAIRRDDDSLVFRTETHEYAAEILANLQYPKQQRIAA